MDHLDDLGADVVRLMKRIGNIASDASQSFACAAKLCRFLRLAALKYVFLHGR